MGFPGETEADFTQTLDLMREAGFDQAFSFKYSPRPQTRAATFPDQVPEDVKAERLARLQALQDELTQKAHARLVGQEQEVLVEGRSKRSPQELVRAAPDQPGRQLHRTPGIGGTSGPGCHNRGSPPFPERPVGRGFSTS